MSNSKRRFEDFAADQGSTLATQPAQKKPCHAPIEHRPRVRYPDHPSSGVGENFHHVPYPLGLMPFDSWALLRQPQDDVSSHRFSCPTCRRRRPAPLAHRRKLFLVAERLSWENGKMPVAELERNQEMTWEVNFQLGIHEPFVEELDQVPGGKHSQENPFYPFEGMSDFSSVMLLVAKGEDLTEPSFNMWQRMLDILHYSHGPDDVVGLHESSVPTGAQYVDQSPDYEVEDLPTPPGSSQLDPSQPSQDFPPSPHNSKKSLEEIARNIPLPTPPVSSRPGPDLPTGTPMKSLGLLGQTPPSSNPGPKASMMPEMDNVGQIDKIPGRPPRRTLPEFYSLLDMIERTSYVSAQFLEAYAEGLQNDCCSECWFALNVGDINEDTP